MLKFPVAFGVKGEGVPEVASISIAFPKGLRATAVSVVAGQLATTPDGTDVTMVLSYDVIEVV